MAVTLDPTPAGASANSYGTLAEASAYFGTRLGTAAWDNADSDDVRKKALITGAREIDQELYRGTKSTSAQALQWPRQGTYTASQVIPSDVVPAFVKYAQFEQALFRLQQSGSDGATKDPLAPTGTEELKSLRAGSVDLQFRDRDAAGSGVPRAADDPSRSLSPAAYRYLRAYIVTDVLHDTDSGIRNFSISRGG